ncbi:MAG: hypothetical protein WB777_26540 [Mycobacterium sp.]
MSLTLSALTRRAVLPGIVVAFTSISAVSIAAPASAATIVPLRSILRACDYSPIARGAAENYASTSAIIRVSGGTVAADVQLSEPGSPNTHFDVSLIQAPRASTSSCTSAGPGVAVGGLDTDGVGQAATTVQDSVRSGTTGVWVFVRRANPYSQTPFEFYTSDFVAPV